MQLIYRMYVCGNRLRQSACVCPKYIQWLSKFSCFLWVFCLFSCLFDQHLTTFIFSGRHAPVCTYEPRNVSELERAGGFDACLHVCKAWVCVCCQALAASSAWASQRAINTWGSRNTQASSLNCIYGPNWDGGEGEGHYVQRRSARGRGPTKTPGLLKPPWMSPRGQWCGRYAGLGLKVRGYVLLLMRSPCWASLALSPQHQCHNFLR